MPKFGDARPMHLLAAVLVTTMIGGWSPPAAADPDKDAAATIRHLICRMVDRAAAAHRLPSGFLTRVVWQESRFRSDARSRAGAEGVAQFMPGTAAERGLTDPTDPEQAIAHAASFLAELAVRFGNLGLAAAAYNAGQGRVTKWLLGQAELPGETRLYVAAVTGRQPEDWRVRRADASTAAFATQEPCIAVTEELARSAPVRTAAARAPAWVVRLDGTLASAVGLLDSIPQPRAATARSASQASVDALCASIRTLGASCQVFAGR